MYPPAICFRVPKDKTDGTSCDYKKFEIKINPADPDSETVGRKAPVFEDGSTEDWLTWCIEFQDLVRELNISTEGTKLTATALTLLKGAARAKFQSILHEKQAKNLVRDEEAKFSNMVIFTQVVNDLAKHYFPTTGDVWRRQINYLRFDVKMSDFKEMTLRQFASRLLRINEYLAFFPARPRGIPAKSLNEDELVSILNHSKPDTWNIMILGTGMDPDVMEWDAAVQYFQQLELRQALENRATNSNGNGGNSTKRKRENESNANGNGNGGGKRTKGPNNGSADKVKCTHCDKYHAGKCWSLDANKHLRPQRARNDNDDNRNHRNNDNRNSNNRNSNKQRMYMTNDQMSYMLKHAFKGMKKGVIANKRKGRSSTRDDSDDDDDDVDQTMNQFNELFSSNKESSDSESIYTNDYNPISRSSLETKEAEVFNCYALNDSKQHAKKQKTQQLTTEIIVEITDRNGDLVPIRALVDTGTTATMLLRQFVAPGTAKAYKGQATTWNTLGGQFVTKKKCQLTFSLPEFDTRKRVQWTCHVDETTDHTKAQYDMIIGTDLLVELGMDIQFSAKQMVWDHMTVPMKPRGFVTERQTAEHLYHTVTAPPVLQEAEARQTRILDADYSPCDIKEFVQSLDHLDIAEKDKMYSLLSSHPELFKGGLGTINVAPVKLELNNDLDHTPYHARAFPVPHCYEATTRKEIDRLCAIGVIAKCNDSEWAAPTFIQPKKTGDVRVLTDFRELNKHIKRNPFPLPKISDLLQKLQGFKYATAIDLSMGYYHVQLDEASQNLCSFVMPWGKYKYLRLPMGIKNSPDIFQGIINNVFSGLDNVKAYLDDILITSNGTYEDHLKKVQEVLERLSQYGFVVNIKKSFFAVSEIEYLGYWITRDGIQPQPKKVEAIHRLTPPKTKRQLRRFLGMVNYYRDMWKRRSHLIAPLTAIVSPTAKFVWTKECQKSFDDIKKVISRETLLAYPDFNKEFHVYTDASDYQLGAVITQNDRPLAFYSRKLNGAQSRYTTGEQELLSIVETLKEYRNILLGYKLIVHTDHKNLLYKKMSTDRLIRWRLLLEEYDVEFRHIAGEKNVVADALSRLDSDYDMDVAEKADTATVASYVMTTREIEDSEFPMSPSLIAKRQKTDKKLHSSIKKDPKAYSTRKVEDVELVTKDDRICVPSTVQSRIVSWYHEYLAHPGETRTEATIRQLFTWPGLRSTVQQYCTTCKQCQLSKKIRRKYGHLPPKTVTSTPWQRVDVDLVGPWTVKTPSGPRYLRALTMIDPITGWFEAVPIDNATAHTVMEAFNNEWLSRYPRPQYIGFDNGSEFKATFHETCTNFGIKPKPSTSHNPQANGIIERVHLVLGDMLRSFELENKDLDEHDPWRPFLSAASWAIRSTYHTTLQATPGQLVFGRDMILPIQFQANWARIAQRKQDDVTRNNAKENAKRIAHVYTVGDKVLVTKPGIIGKMAAPREGPYAVTKVYTNGNVRIQKGIVNDRINIRRLTPFYERNN